MKKITINVAKDFTNTPGYTDNSYGKFSGDEFKNNILIPALNNNDCVVIDLDGCYGFSIGFLNFAFYNLNDYDKVRLRFISMEDPFLINEIEEIMFGDTPRLKKYYEYLSDSEIIPSIEIIKTACAMIKSNNFIKENYKIFSFNIDKFTNKDINYN